MRWYLATDQQLETIFNSDDHCPNHLLVGVVEEMMKRGMFEGMIIKVVKKLMGSYNRDEVIQAAHIGIYQLAKRFEPMKLSFKQMCYIAIERRIKTLQQKSYYKNNFANEQALQNEVPEMESSFNVEKAVIRKLLMQEQFSKLSGKEKRIVDLFLQGYSIAYIAIHEYKQDPKAIHYHFNKALAKMDIHDFKIGGRTGLKGA